MANLTYKVIYGGDVQFDLTGDSVSADKIEKVLLSLIRAVQRSQVPVPSIVILPNIMRLSRDSEEILRTPVEVSLQVLYEVQWCG